MKDFRGLISKLSKFNRESKKNKSKKKDIIHPEFLLTALPDESPMYNFYEQNLSSKINSGLPSHSHLTAGESLKLLVITSTLELTIKEL